MTNQQIIQQWVNSMLSGNNCRGKASHIIADNNAIYSYGRHYPMGVYKDGKFYVNSEKISTSTSRQQNQLKNAIGGGYELRTTKQLQALLAHASIV